MFYLADAAIILIFALALVLLGWSEKPDDKSLLEKTAIGMGQGLGLTSCAVALLLARGDWEPKNFLTLGPLIFCLFFFLLYRNFSSVKSNAKRAWNGVLNLRGLDTALFLYLVSICALTLVLSLAPPNGSDYDSLVYHLAAPAQYLRAGRIVELPYDHHSYFPLLTEMLFALGLSLKGPVLAKLFHWLMLPLCCMALMAMGSRHFSRRAGLLGACLFASLPVVMTEATTGYVDLSLCAWVLLAFLCFANWLAVRKRSWLLWCGVFCGFALGTKYSGTLFFGWLLLWAIGVLVANRTRSVSEGTTQRQALADASGSVLGFAIVAILIGGGWYLKNILWTGNPVFPFAYEVFRGKGWTLQMAKDYTQSQHDYGFGRAPLDFLMLPWRIAMTPLNARHPFWPFSQVEITSAATGTGGLFEVNVLDMVVGSFVGPILLALGVPLLLMRRKPALIGLILWSALFLVTFWFFTGQYLRYLLPTFALLCSACGWSASQFLKRSAILKWTTMICLTAWCVFTPLLIINNARVSWAVILGVEAPDEYLNRTFSAYPACVWVSQNTPQNSVLAVYCEPRGFYLNRKYFLADTLHNTLVSEPQMKNADEWIDKLRALGATHLFWNSAPERNGGVGGKPRFLDEAVAQKRLILLFESRAYRVYQIAP